MEWTVNIIDLLSLFSTVVLTFYVVFFLERSKEERRAEKDLILGEVNIMIGLTRTLNDGVQSGPRHHNEMVWKVKEIKVHFLRITQLIGECSFSVKRNQIDSSIASLRQLDMLLTYTQPRNTTQGNTAITTITSGLVTYSSGGLVEINRCCGDLVTSLHLLQLRLNKA